MRPPAPDCCVADHRADRLAKAAALARTAVRIVKKIPIASKMQTVQGQYMAVASQSIFGEIIHEERCVKASHSPVIAVSQSRFAASGGHLNRGNSRMLAPFAKAPSAGSKSCRRAHAASMDVEARQGARRSMFVRSCRPLPASLNSPPHTRRSTASFAETRPMSRCPSRCFATLLALTVAALGDSLAVAQAQDGNAWRAVRRRPLRKRRRSAAAAQRRPQPPTGAAPITPTPMRPERADHARSGHQGLGATSERPWPGVARVRHHPLHHSARIERTSRADRSSTGSSARPVTKRGTRRRSASSRPIARRSASTTRRRCSRWWPTSSTASSATKRRTTASVCGSSR